MADSDSLFYLRTQYYLGAYQNVAKNPLPPTDSPEYLPTLLYTARAHIALNNPAAALDLVQADVIPAVRAIRGLASYLQAKSSGSDVETILDELRDLAIEVEGEEEEEHPLPASGAGSGVVRVAAATAFVREGELEEALTTLGVGTDKGVSDLECVYLTVQIYLSIARIDLAKKIYLAAKKAQSNIKNNSSNLNNDLLLQLTEASLGLVSGGSLLDTAYHIYDEAASSPGSSTNGGIIAKKGVTYLMRGHLVEAEASFDEALSLTSGAPASSGLSGDALVGKSVVKLLSGKTADADNAYETLRSTLPQHPYVVDVEAKSALFDQLKANFKLSGVAA